jgi:hypothetical protein
MTSSNWICMGALDPVADLCVCVWLVAANAPVLHIVELETVEHGDALLGRGTKTKQDTIRERENKTIYYHLKSLDGFRLQAFVCAPDLKSRSSLL